MEKMEKGEIRKAGRTKKDNRTRKGIQKGVPEIYKDERQGSSLY